MHKASTHSLVETLNIHVHDDICVRLMRNIDSARLCEVDVSDDSVGEKLCQWLCVRDVCTIDV